jgi:hypothetical protein
MAGYRIAFDGSLAERKNLVQSVGNSSMTAAGAPATLSPAKWDNFSGGTPLAIVERPATYVHPNIYTEALNGTSPIFAVNYSAGDAFLAFLLNAYYFLSQTLPAGTIDYSISTVFTSGTIAAVQLYRSPSGAVRSHNGQLGPGVTTLYNAVGGTHTINGSVTVDGSQSLLLECIGGIFSVGAMRVNYIRYTQTSSVPVTIFNATNVDGAAPAGGIATVASPSTILNGQLALAGAPKLFGARVVHDSSDILEAKYLPPADVSEDAEANAKATKFITATSTTLSVESDGLGSAERLGANETSLIVEEIIGAVEN